MDRRASPCRGGEGSRAFPLDSFCGASWPRGGGALKVPAQRSTLAGRRGFARARVKNHSPSRKHSPQAHHGGAETGV